MTRNEQHSRYNASSKGKARTAKYRSTAKGFLMRARQDAKRRGTR